MTNKEIANTFQILANLMELHELNPFKIKSYQNAYLALRKFPEDLSTISVADLENIKGIGKAISGKIVELLSTGKLAAIEELMAQTPAGIAEMLTIRGFGPKKVRTIWKELGVESVGELLYACNENRLVELNGFGVKTQEELKQKLEYFQKSMGKFLFADVEKAARTILQKFETLFPDAKVELTGAIRRNDNTVEGIEILFSGTEDDIHGLAASWITLEEKTDSSFKGHLSEDTPITIHLCQQNEFGSMLFKHTANKAFLDEFLKTFPGIDFRGLKTEEEVFEKAGLAYMAPELREDGRFIKNALQGSLPELITHNDIKGVLHTHTTGSDGINTLVEMATHAREMGYQYIGITDHSKSAYYANGMIEARLESQWAEIDKLNRELAPFKIYKGIESDILNDGSLDYEPDFLSKFDLIIASIHSNLRMDEEKATKRLLRAIENPHTTILGHMTGRLLLSRQGYPVDHLRIIDACAANNVAIELNANPYRLDIDYTWIPKAVEKGVLISINPDAHSISGITDIYYGVLSARKGGLETKHCLCSLTSADFQEFISKRKSRF